jgi:diphthine synthase
MLYLIGLGLGDEKDITVKGLEVVKSCEEVWLESYTAILPGINAERLSVFYGKEVKVADREKVESGITAIIEKARNVDVALLVVGDPFGATTHTDLWLRAKKIEVPVKVIHNASIMNAIGACGLSLYAFGQTVSIPLFQGNWRPDSFYERILSNKKMGLHTLCLLDIKVKEPNLQILETRGKFVYDPPYYMSVKEACLQLMQVEETKKQGLLLPETLCIGVARIGRDDQKIGYGTLKQLSEYDGFGEPLHSIVIIGEVHPLEVEILKYFEIQ